MTVLEASAPPAPAEVPDGPVPPAGDGLGRRRASVVIVIALTLTAAFAFQRVFDVYDLVPVVVVAALVPALLAALLSGRRRAWPLITSLFLSLAVWLFVVSATLFRGTSIAGFIPGPDTLRELGFGLKDSWKGLLTTILPAPPAPGLLILVHVLTWLTALASVELAVRSRAVAAPAVPAVALFAVALLFGVNGPSSNVPVAGVFVALVVVLALVRSDRSLGWLGVGLPAALALGLVAGLAGRYLPVSAQPYDPREHVQPPPPRQFDSVSPLDRVSAWLQHPDQPMFSVRFTARENLRLAVLDRFDGTVWSSSAKFMPTGGRVPAATQPGAESGIRETVEQQYTIDQLPGRWLPMVDRPRTVTVNKAGMIVDPASGMISVTQPLQRGMSYAVESSVRRHTKEELRVAVPGRDPESVVALDLPSGPGGANSQQLDRFRSIARTATRGSTQPFQQAKLLADYLRKRAKYDVTASPGHTYANLEYFLISSQRGTSEQFATAFAVLARTLGLPSRVVVGFRPGRDAGGYTLVRSGDVLVWPEVSFAGLGWVPFYPTPEKGDASGSQDVPAGASKKRQDIENELGKDTSDKPTPKKTGGPGEKGPGDETATGIQWWMVAGGSAAGLIMIYLLISVFVPLVRRMRRRRRPTPVARIVGAWQQTLDNLRDVGLPASVSRRPESGGPPPQALTAHEVAGFGSTAMGNGAGRHLHPLADLVNLAGFAAAGPGVRAADDAWRLCDAVDRMIIQHAGRRKRWLRRLNPLSLFR